MSAAPKDASMCPQCGEPVYEQAYVDTYQRVTLVLSEEGDAIEVDGYPGPFETGEDYRDFSYFCRSCSADWPDLEALFAAHITNPEETA